MAKKCSSCGDEVGFLKGGTFQLIKEKEYCAACAAKYVADAISTI